MRIYKKIMHNRNLKKKKSINNILQGLKELGIPQPAVSQKLAFKMKALREGY